MLISRQQLPLTTTEPFGRELTLRYPVHLRTGFHTGYNREGSSLRLGASSRHVDFVEEHMPLTDNQSRERIRELNDAFRKTLDPGLGRKVCTAGVTALPSDVCAMAIRKVATFDDFTADNDPH